MAHKRGPMMQGEKPKNFKATMLKLGRFLGQYKFPIMLVIFLAIGSAAFSIIGPKLIGNATTEIFNGLIDKINGGTGINFQTIGKILLFLLGLYIISMLFSMIQSFVMSGVTQKVAYTLRKQQAEKMNRLPMKYFDRYTHGEILSRITNDIDTLTQSLNQSMTQLITSVTMFIGVLIMMISISPLMTLTILITLPLSLGSISVIVKKSQKYFKKQQEYLGHINGEVEEVYGGHHIVKAFNREEVEIEKFNELNDELYHTAWKSQFLSGMMMPIMNFIGNLGYVIVSILGGYLVIQKKIEVGEILSFTQYIRMFTQPLSQIAQVMNMLQSTAAAAERVFEFLEEEEEVEETRNPIQVKNIDGRIEFKHVAFGYHDDLIIHDFNAVVEPGMKVAIVGPTGAGKSTVIKLLMRFYDVTKGEILVDGHNIQEFKRQDLRKLFGMVLQDTWLFHGTIAENVKYGRLNASYEEIEEACKAAHVHHFITTLPDGYKMMLSEEANNISNGQKQLLTIARVILADPKILILDEATSSVDTRTEILISQAMDDLMKNRTSFIIAHRLSTIKNADMILVMDHGDIVEVGKHEELLKKDGFYAKLYNSQFEEVEA